MKRKITCMWLLTALCLVITVILWFAMDRSNPEYEEVKARVVSTGSRSLVNKKTGSRTTLYVVTVEYEGKEQELGNVHGLAGYMEGATVTAYLSEGKLYANPEGVKTSTPLSKVYFAFLFGTFGMLGLTLYVMNREQEARKKEKEDRTNP